MKHKTLAIDGALSSITCDRCGQTWQSNTVDAAEFTSLDFTGGYGSVFGDGSQVKLDLCQRCLKTALGLWLRVSDHDRQEHAPPRDFDAFDSGKHGGKVFADATFGLELLAEDACAAADRSPQAIDAAIEAVEQSKERIEKMESVARLKGMFGAPDHTITIEQMQCGNASPNAGTRDGADQIGNVVVGLIERDLDTGQFGGKVIGFPHFEYVGQSAIEVQSKLTRAVTSLIEQGDLVLESQFVAVVVVGSERLKDADD
jgi:hypothetical protein